MLRRVLVGAVAPMRTSVVAPSMRFTAVRAFATAKKGGKAKAAPKAAPKAAASAASVEIPPASTAAGVKAPLVPQNWAEVGEFPKLASDHGHYVKTLFDVGMSVEYYIEPGKNNFDQIVCCLRMLNESEEFNSVYQNPLVPDAKKQEFLKYTHEGLLKVLVDGMHPVALRFLQVLSIHGDTAMLTDILKDLDMVVAWANRRVSCEVTSATELSDAQMKSLQVKVTAMRDAKEVLDFKYNVEPKMLGGLKVLLGDEVADMSVATRLDNFHTMLRNSSRDE